VAASISGSGRVALTEAVLTTLPRPAVSSAARVARTAARKLRVIECAPAMT
jgi:hypothetical protein